MEDIEDIKLLIESSGETEENTAKIIGKITNACQNEQVD
jgi:hypothetical protein